jgi:hypothetical protein
VGTEPAGPLSSNKAILWAQVSNPDNTSEVWVQIRYLDPKNPLVDPEGEIEQQEINLIDIPLERKDDTKRYEEIYEGFETPGRYALFFYAKDETGIISPSKRIFVYKEDKDDNNPPGDFNLLFPENEAVITRLAGLTAIWEEAVDPDGDSVTYTLEIVHDPNDERWGEDTFEYRKEGLVEDFAVIDLYKAGALDLHSYIWYVTAVDEYGAEKNSNERNFTIDDYNGTFSARASGCVYGENNERISNLDLQINVTPNEGTNIDITEDGKYIFGGEPEKDYTFYISATSYKPNGGEKISLKNGEARCKNFSLVKKTPQNATMEKVVIVDMKESNKDKLTIFLRDCENMENEIENLNKSPSQVIKIEVKINNDIIYETSIPWFDFKQTQNNKKYKFKGKYGDEKHNDKVIPAKNRMKFKIKNTELNILSR